MLRAEPTQPLPPKAAEEHILHISSYTRGGRIERETQVLVRCATAARASTEGKKRQGGLESLFLQRSKTQRRGAISPEEKEHAGGAWRKDPRDPAEKREARKSRDKKRKKKNRGIPLRGVVRKTPRAVRRKCMSEDYHYLQRRLWST